MKRRIKKANITFVSLCPRGKNKMPTIFKEDGTIEFETLIKDESFEAEGFLTAVVYAPEIRDTDGDIASVEVIKQMAYDYMRGGGELDVRHDGKALTKDQAFIAENFLIQKADPRFLDMKTNDGEAIDVTGGWAMVIKVDDPELRKAYGEDGWDGVSFFGKAEVEIEDDKAAEDLKVNRIVKALGKMLAGDTDEEIDMKPEELLKALQENNETLLKGLGEVLKEKKPEVKKEVKKTDDDDKIKFEGDPLNTEDVKKHLTKVEKAKLLKDVDFSDPEALKKLLKSGESKEDGETEEVKGLRKQLEKALSKSGQPSGKGKKSDDDDDDDTIPAGLTKEEADGFALGHKIGKHSNLTRGFVKE